MKFKIVMTVLLVLLAGSLAQAQVTTHFVQRYTSVDLHPDGGIPQLNYTDEAEIGPRTWDFELTEGDLHARSVHESNIMLEGLSMTVTGTFMTEVSDNAAPLEGSASASATLGFTFSVETESYMELDVTVGNSGEVFFGDQADNDPWIEYHGPGHFTLERTLVPDRIYLFQVHQYVGIGAGSELSNVENASISLTVEGEPVPTTIETWGAVKALFR